MHVAHPTAGSGLRNRPAASSAGADHEFPATVKRCKRSGTSRQPARNRGPVETTAVQLPAATDKGPCCHTVAAHAMGRSEKPHHDWASARQQQRHHNNSNKILPTPAGHQYHRQSSSSSSSNLWHLVHQGVGTHGGKGRGDQSDSQADSATSDVVTWRHLAVLWTMNLRYMHTSVHEKRENCTLMIRFPCIHARASVPSIQCIFQWEAASASTTPAGTCMQSQVASCKDSA